MQVVKAKQAAADDISKRYETLTEDYAEARRQLMGWQGREKEFAESQKMIGFFKDEAFKDKTEKNYQALEITSLKDKTKRQ